MYDQVRNDMTHVAQIRHVYVRRHSTTHRYRHPVSVQVRWTLRQGTLPRLRMSTPPLHVLVAPLPLSLITLAGSGRCVCYDMPIHLDIPYITWYKFMSFICFHVLYLTNPLEYTAALFK